MKIITQNGNAIQTPKDPLMWTLFNDGRYIWYAEGGVLGWTLILTCRDTHQAEDALENIGDVSQKQYLDFRNFESEDHCK